VDRKWRCANVPVIFETTKLTDAFGPLLWESQFFIVKEIQLTGRIDRYAVAVKVAICIRHFIQKVMVLRVCCFQGEVVPLAIVLAEAKGILTIDTVGPDVLYQTVLCT